MCNEQRQLQLDFGMKQLAFDFNDVIVAVEVDVDDVEYAKWIDQQIDIELGRYEYEDAFIVKNF